MSIQMLESSDVHNAFSLLPMATNYFKKHDSMLKILLSFFQLRNSSFPVVQWCGIRSQADLALWFNPATSAF